MDNQWRILIADDDDLYSGVLMDALGERGFAVDRANDGLAAIEKLNTCTYDVLLLDMFMPGATGLDVLRHIRSTNLPCKVIVVTGYTSDSMVREAKALTVDDVLAKPFNTSDLLFSIEKVLA